MARPTRIAQSAILEAARELFVAEGYDVSTAAIAEAAGCSEGTIFKRFKTKERLFREALGLPDFDIAARLEAVADRPDLEESLTEVCLEIVEFLRVLVPRVMRLWAHDTGKKDPYAQRRYGPHTPLLALANFFDDQMRRGRLAPRDPEILARIVMGSMHNYVFLELVGVHARMPIPATTYVRGFVDMIFHGVAPAQPLANTGTNE